MRCVAVLVLLLCLCTVARGLDNGLGLTPPMGWNTWCTQGNCGRDYCDSQEIMSIADAMAANGMKEAGYEYINFDDCWADYRDTDGTIVPDKTRFPDGLVPVIQYVNSKGFKLGVYTDAGLYTCSQGGRSHKIPGSYGHYQQDAKTYASWGVQYVKMDWCNTKVNGTQLDPKVQYAEMSKELNATGKPIFFNSCEWGVEEPWLWMKQYANSWRSGPDHHDEWKSTADIIENNVGKGKYAGNSIVIVAAAALYNNNGVAYILLDRGGWNDADFLMTGGQGCSSGAPYLHCPGMTDTEYRTEFSLWSIMGSSLIVATDVRNMTDIMKEVILNTEMIAVNQDPHGKGGDKVGNWRCSEGSYYCQIWAKPLHDGSYAVGLYNAGSRSHDITLQFSLLNITTSVTLRDIWAHKDLGTFSNTFTVEVDSHGIEVYKVTKS